MNARLEIWIEVYATDGVGGVIRQLLRIMGTEVFQCKTK